MTCWPALCVVRRRRLYACGVASEQRITVRLSDDQLAKLDELAATAGTSRAVVLRRLIEGAEAAEPPTEALDRDGAMLLVSEQARSGSVPALRVILDERRYEDGVLTTAALNELALGDAA
jgi:metal-responsive CopG/Arc/MetJ family transcriptional regulator